MLRTLFDRYHQITSGGGRRALQICALVAVGAAATGCSEQDLPESEGLVYLSPWSGRDLQAEPAAAVAPRELSAEEQANYDQIAKSFVENSDSLLTRDDVVQRLESIEQVFLLTGRYLELVALYQKAVEAAGPTSPAAPALAWSYVQLGQEPQARALIDELKAARPNEAVVYVLDASLHLASMERESAAGQKALESFKRARALDPNFGPFRGLTAAGIAEQINRLETRQARTSGATQNAVAAAEDQAPVETNPSAAETNTPPVETNDSPAETNQPPAAQNPVAQNPAAQNQPPLGQARENSPVLTPAAPGPERQAAIMVADGQITMARGEDHFEEAQRYFRRALEFEPNNIAAGLGLLQIASRSGAPDEVVRSQIALLEKQPHLNARQAYELAMIALRRLNDRPLGTSLLQKVQELDPRYAERVGVDALLTP